MKFRLSKKVVIVTVGLLAICAGSGAAAVYVGTDKLLGPSYLEINGLECTTLQTDKIKRDNRNWIRKYVVSDKPGDGMARIRTALRVARAVQEKEKADLVQVAVLDKSGPTERAEMRGRVIGAQVVYIPDLAKAPDGAQVQTYSAYYMDGSPTPKGEYFGLRMDVPLEDVEALSAKLTDKADCVDPVVAAPEGEHGAPSAHGDKKKPKPKGGEHGAAAEGHGDSGSEGHAAEPEASHSEEGKPAADGHGAPDSHEGATGHEDQVASKESGGFLGSVTSMIFGSKEEPKPDAAAGEAKSGDAHGADADAAPAEGHGAMPTEAKSHAAPEPVAKPAPEAAAKPAPEAAGKAAPEAAGKAAPEHAAKAEAATETKAAVTEPAETAKEEGGMFSSLKGMIFGSGEAEKPAEPLKEASAEPAKPSEEAPPPRTSTEGGKRWSSQTEADAIHSDKAPPPSEAKATQAPPPTDGSTEADAAGAAWLAKFRQQQADSAKAATAPAAAEATKPAH
jgi:hypothetical protein